jgi:hypothetical protein
MTDVGSWQPDDAIAIDGALLARLTRAAAALDAPGFGLSADEIARYASCMRREPEQWHAAVAALDDATLEGLIRLFTLAEAKLPNWEAGNRSPVIPLVALLRKRGTYPKTLTAWIKANSDNRFLPWGSLLDRL